MQEHSAAAPALPAWTDGPPVSPLPPASSSRPRPRAYSLVATLANGETVSLGSFGDASIAIERGTTLASELERGARTTFGLRTLDPETVDSVEVFALRPAAA